MAAGPTGSRTGKTPAGAGSAAAGRPSALIARQIEAARGAAARGGLQPAREAAPAPPLNTKTAKFHRLIRLLQDATPGLSIRQMASTLGVDERTVKRYLADIRRLKLDLVPEPDPRGRTTLFRIPGAGGPPAHLLNALKKIRAELHAGGNPKHSSHILQVIRFLEDPASPTGRDAAARGPARTAAVESRAPEPAAAPGAEVYYIDHGPFAEADPNPGILKILEAAVASRTAIKVTYSSYTKETEEFLFFPYILSLRVGTLYLIGRQGEHKGPFKSLSVKRIRRAIATRDAFRPDPFNPADYYKYTFGQWHRQLNEAPETALFRLEAPWLEKYLSESRFHPPGRVFRKGGAAWFELEVVIKPDFVNWVLSLSPDLVPVKPASLREEVTRRLRQGLESVGKE